MGYMKQCSKIPDAAPATMCVLTVLDAGRLSYSLSQQSIGNCLSQSVNKTPKVSNTSTTTSKSNYQKSNVMSFLKALQCLQMHTLILVYASLICRYKDVPWPQCQGHLEVTQCFASVSPGPKFTMPRSRLSFGLQRIVQIPWFANGCHLPQRDNCDRYCDDKPWLIYFIYKHFVAYGMRNLHTIYRNRFSWLAQLLYLLFSAAGKF